MAGLRYRHELKHFIGATEALALRSRLDCLLQRDRAGGPLGTYLVHSLYFDTPECAALADKIDGAPIRSKFRLRYYNDNLALIRLEQKYKHFGMTAKRQACLAEVAARRIVAGDVEWCVASEDPVLREFSLRWRTEMLRPAAIVRYHREAWLMPAGNVRITIDSDVRRVLGSFDPFERRSAAIPLLETGQSILEVKYDEFLPGLVRDLVQTGNTMTVAASKYAMARRFA